MYRLRTRADLLVMLVISALVTGMGVLFFIHPPRPVPSDPGAYERVSGVATLVVDRSARKSSRVEFRLAGDPRVFETRSVVYRGGADHWTPGQTRLVFYIERGGPFIGVAVDPIPALGLLADGRASRTLDEDIAYSNGATGPWAGVLALSIGLFGLATALLVWRKQSSA